MKRTKHQGLRKDIPVEVPALEYATSGIDLLPLPTQNYSMKSVHYSIGSRTYELSNQLPSVLPSAVGNVLSVISDKVIPVFPYSNVISEMRADIRVAQDYSPFGVTLDGRNFVVSEGYRYGFQGQEMDDEIKGAGNSVNYTFRMHDPRIGRFFALDPLTSEYPHYTPYSFSGNKVIHAIELEGLEEFIVIKHEDYYVFWDASVKSDPTKKAERGKIEMRTNSGEVIEKMRPLGVKELKDEWFKSRLNASSSNGQSKTSNARTKSGYEGESHVLNNSGERILRIEDAKKILDVKFPSDKIETLPIESKPRETSVNDKKREDSPTKVQKYHYAAIYESNASGEYTKLIALVRIPEQKNPQAKLGMAMIKRVRQLEKKYPGKHYSGPAIEGIHENDKEAGEALKKQMNKK